VGFAAERAVRRTVEHIRSAREQAEYHRSQEKLSRGYVEATGKALADAERWLAQAGINRRRRPDDREMMRPIENATPFWEERTVQLRTEIDDWRRGLDYHSRMRRKWERAARFPWPSVHRDPIPRPFM